MRCRDQGLHGGLNVRRGLAISDGCQGELGRWIQLGARAWVNVRRLWAGTGTGDLYVYTQPTTRRGECGRAANARVVLLIQLQRCRLLGSNVRGRRNQRQSEATTNRNYLLSPQRHSVPPSTEVGAKHQSFAGCTTYHARGST